MDPISEGIKSIQSAQKIGKDAAKIVTDIQSDMESTVQAAHRKRERERKLEAQALINLELKAIEKFEEDQKRKRMLDDLQRDLTKRHGKNAWNEVQTIKSDLNKINQEESKYMDRDRRKVEDLFWYCIGAAAIITYLFKLYKI